MAGVSFNNRNWKHILKAIKIWSASTVTISSLVWTITAVVKVPPSVNTAAFIALLGGLFVPIYITAKKYE